jgi:large subunit ribosomal protein L28
MASVLLRLPIPLREEFKLFKILEFVMAQVCEICGKGPQFGNKISHAHNVSRRRWNINLRPVKAKVNSGQKRLRVCTRCIKAGKVVKP